MANYTKENKKLENKIKLHHNKNFLRIVGLMMTNVVRHAQMSFKQGVKSFVKEATDVMTVEYV